MEKLFAISLTSAEWFLVLLSGRQAVSRQQVRSQSNLAKFRHKCCNNVGWLYVNRWFHGWWYESSTLWDSARIGRILWRLEENECIGDSATSAEFMLHATDTRTITPDPMRILCPWLATSTLNRPTVDFWWKLTERECRSIMLLLQEKNCTTLHKIPLPTWIVSLATKSVKSVFGEVSKISNSQTKRSGNTNW
jgi:hypothetical protein